MWVWRMHGLASHGLADDKFCHAVARFQYVFFPVWRCNLCFEVLCRQAQAGWNSFIQLAASRDAAGHSAGNRRINLSKRVQLLKSSNPADKISVSTYFLHTCPGRILIWSNFRRGHLFCTFWRSPEPPEPLQDSEERSSSSCWKQ